MTAAGIPSRASWNAWEENGHTFRVITDIELSRFTRYCLKRRGRTAIDAGCGNGAFTRQLHRFGFDVTGLDFADGPLAAARRTPLAGVGYRNHDLNHEDPPQLPPHGIDLVVCRLVLPFLDQPYAWVRRVRDHWLSDQGQLYLVIPVVNGHATQPGGMTEEEIADLSNGWSSIVRYDLRGPLACLVLGAARE
ncbi:class I SAM-dependent methyltransferase [Streptomyces lydicus]|uniref:class I SAM-dependent methyltransferase n=1 Tax=Streptomyces lydicus TaxID=47763 RepID=UPI0013E954C4|nr:class I SAM-dependent methyltransferase [Streptomyces lydicus]MCZ1012238.1 class I SAM-dependent methyltransferase [Streptomyces lydicus]